MEQHITGSCTRCTSLEQLLEQYEEQVRQLHQALAVGSERERKVEEETKLREIEYKGTMRHLESQVQAAEDRTHVLSDQCGELERQLNEAEQTHVFYSIEIADLNAHVIKLNTLIDSQHEQIEILQGMSQERGHPAAVAHPCTNVNRTIRRGSQLTSVQHKPVNRRGDFEMRWDRTPSSSNFDSFSDVSWPSAASVEEYDSMHTPRTDSSSPPMSLRATTSDGDVWSDLGADSVVDLNHIQLQVSGLITPPRISSLSPSPNIQMLPSSRPSLLESPTGDRGREDEIHANAIKEHHANTHENMSNVSEVVTRSDESKTPARDRNL